MPKPRVTPRKPLERDVQRQMLDQSSAYRHICGMRIFPLARLRAVIARAGNQRAAATELGISFQYLNDILHGRRQISAAVAKKLGLIREVVYRSAK